MIDLISAVELNKVEVDPSWFSIKKCKENPTKLYVFGDNIRRVGNAGQAQIRICKNSTGLATKLYPGMEPGDFMSDNLYNEHCMIIDKDIQKILKVFENKDNGYTEIVFPIDGLGTGLSKLPEKAPKVYEFLCNKLFVVFGLLTDVNGKLVKANK